MPHRPPTPFIDDQLPELVSLREAATQLGVAPQMMRYPSGGGVAHRHGLRAVRAGRLVLYRAADVAAVAAGHQPLPWQDPPEMLSAGQIAVELGGTVTPAIVTEHAKAGRLPCRRIGGRDVVVRAELVRLLRELVAAYAQGHDPDEVAAAGEVSPKQRAAVTETARRLAARTAPTSHQ